jgi:hypothetical protein
MVILGSLMQVPLFFVNTVTDAATLLWLVIMDAKERRPANTREQPDAPGRIRTSDQQLRRLLLYPPELRARATA